MHTTKKVIVISGGSDGLGKELAKTLSGKSTVIVIGRNEQKTMAAAAECGCAYAVADVGNAEAITHAVAEIAKTYGAIDCLINNAGSWIEGPVDTNSLASIKETIQTNTLGTIFLTSLVVPHMKKQHAGRIINVISTAGLTTKADRSVYHASKWAITGFTRSLAMELSPFGIGVTGFYPGAMKTDFFKKAGLEKNMDEHMDLAEAVRCLQFIIDTDPSVSISDLSIRPTE